MDVDTLVSEIERYNQTEKKVDTVMLQQSVENIINITNLVLGLMVGFLLVGIGVVISLEVAYLAFPVFKEFVDKTKVKFDKHPKLTGFILRDADRAYKEHAESGGAKNAFGCYIKIKFKSLLIVGFLVVMLIAGGPFLSKLLGNMIAGLITAFNGI